ncbi:DUF305 domain-containing protein [Nonomuraea zeae]|uniref:DUF305 domain-containing protein n=1 Tax=Nonomuraea zeae TaxID=1642303 RepID=UPI001478A337|nr:DUF305 domain-containing protein [Nonomuraea zeae]
MPRILAVLLLLLLAGCSAAGQPSGQHAAGQHAAPQPSGHHAAAQPNPRYSATDVAWLQLAEALHARALPLLELAPDRAAGRPLAELAVRLGERHESGRDRLRALLAQARVSGENPHTQHDMPGMPTADDLRALSDLRDDAFDRRFVTLLRAYLDQLVLVAKGEQTAGGDREVRELAAAMQREHAAELAELAGLEGAAR